MSASPFQNMIFVRVDFCPLFSLLSLEYLEWHLADRRCWVTCGSDERINPWLDVKSDWTHLGILAAHGRMIEHKKPKSPQNKKKKTEPQEKQKKALRYTSPDNGTNCFLMDVCCYGDTSQENGEDGRERYLYNFWNGLLPQDGFTALHSLLPWDGSQLEVSTWCLRFCKPDCLLWRKLREDPGPKDGDGARRGIVIQWNEGQNGNKESGFSPSHTMNLIASCAL